MNAGLLDACYLKKTLEAKVKPHDVGDFHHQQTAAFDPFAESFDETYRVGGMFDDMATGDNVVTLVISVGGGYILTDCIQSLSAAIIDHALGDIHTGDFPTGFSGGPKQMAAVAPDIKE